MRDSTGFLMDACVLIDFLKTDRSVLKLISEYVGPVHVIGPVVTEVRKHIENENELVELGLCIIEPELEDGFRAVSLPGPTSYPDRLCLLTAKREGLTLVTNDTHLRKLCRTEQVSYLWGLEPLCELHQTGGISAQAAIGIAQQIHETNSWHITSAILERFIEKIRSMM